MSSYLRRAVLATTTVVRDRFDSAASLTETCTRPVVPVGAATCTFRGLNPTTAAARQRWLRVAADARTHTTARASSPAAILVPTFKGPLAVIATRASRTP
jgi:hypothetical protein